MSKDIQMMGNVGYCIDDGNIISFQVGSNPMASVLDMDQDPEYKNLPANGIGGLRWLTVDGYHVAARGRNNRLVEEIEHDFKKNRLIPRLISKQINMLYGKGLCVYKAVLQDGKPVRQWTDVPAITDWLNSWKDSGLEMSANEVALGLIKNFYNFRDYFVKWRFTAGASLGFKPVAGLELLENKHCRLACNNKNVAIDLIHYNDLRYVLEGKWDTGIAKYKVYPKFHETEVNNYQFAAISHHREYSVGEYYGCNETYSGTRPWIKGANDSPEYINSFLRNSLAAKVHVIIPNAWIVSKRTQITNICNENKDRKSKGLEPLKYNGIDVGVTFKESSLILYMKEELRTLSKYLSGKDNQGKAYASISFKNGAGTEEERWRIETLDLKYKEYISSLIEYDKRADEVLLGSVGLDSSISSVSKDGVISKSGADVYYNYLVYLLTLTPDDEKCSEPFNMAIKINFPDLYKQGFRLGYYREVPARQEQVSPNDRLNAQES